MWGEEKIIVWSDIWTIKRWSHVALVSPACLPTPLHNHRSRLLVLKKGTKQEQPTIFLFALKEDKRRTTNHPASSVSQRQVAIEAWSPSYIWSLPLLNGQWYMIIYHWPFSKGIMTTCEMACFSDNFELSTFEHWVSRLIFPTFSKNPKIYLPGPTSITSFRSKGGGENFSINSFFQN